MRDRYAAEHALATLLQAFDDDLLALEIDIGNLQGQGFGYSASRSSNNPAEPLDQLIPPLGTIEKRPCFTLGEVFPLPTTVIDGPLHENKSPCCDTGTWQSLILSKKPIDKYE